MSKLKYKIAVLMIISNYCSSVRAQSITEIGCTGDVVNYTFKDDSLNILYVSCVTYNSDGSNSTSIQKWDGTIWEEIASIINGEVKSMIKLNGNLIIAGSFIGIDGNIINNIAEWNDTSWNALGINGLGNAGCAINSLCMINGTLLAGGDFGKDPVNNLFKWNGSSWLPFQQYVNGKVLSLCNFNDTLYLCGDIEYIDTLKIHGIARYSDSSWTNLSDCFAGNVFNMITFDGKLYFSGLFGCINDNPSGIIASYDGSVITGLGERVRAFITAMHVFDDKLYIGGEFLDTLGESAQKIAAWDGAAWREIDFSFVNISQIMSISHFGSSIIVAGRIKDENNSVRKIVEYNQE